MNETSGLAGYAAQQAQSGYGEVKLDRELMFSSLMGRLEKEIERGNVIATQLDQRLGPFARSSQPRAEDGSKPLNEVMPPALELLSTVLRRLEKTNGALSSLLSRLEI